MRNVLMVLVILGLVLVNTAQVHAIDIYALPAGDGFWHDEMGSSYDYFDSTSGGVSAHYQFFGTGGSVSFNTGYAQFSLNSTPAAASITSASLYLNLASAYLTGSTPTAGSINHASNSTGATGNASQRFGGNEFVSSIMPSMTLGWNAFDVTDYIKNDVTNSYNWSVFSFDPNTSGDYDWRYAGFSFSTAEGGAPAYLSINNSAVPEPATMVLFGIGTAAMAFARRKKKLA